MFSELRIEVNKACNYRCVHCYTEKKGPESVSVEKFEETIRESAARGATDLSLTGGEPLLEPERTLRLVRAGSTSGLRVRLNTNGHLLDAARARELAAAGLAEVQVSLSAAEAAEFDALVRKRGAFGRVRQALVEAKRAGLYVTIRFTLMTSTSAQMTPVLRLAESVPVDRLKVRCLVEVNGVHDASADKRDKTLSALTALARDSERSPLKVEVAGISLKAESIAGACQQQRCKCGADALFIGSEGTIVPCPFLREEPRFRLGDIQNDDLFDVYSTSSVLRDFIGARTSNLAGNQCTDACRAAELLAEGQLVHVRL